MYAKSRDLILLCLFGLISYALIVGTTGNLTRLPVGEHFIYILLVSILLGTAISRPSQMIEWPICFLFGGGAGSAMLVSFLTYMGMSFTLFQASSVISHTLAWFGVLSAFMLIGIIVGFFLKSTAKLIVGSLRFSKS